MYRSEPNRTLQAISAALVLALSLFGSTDGFANAVGERVAIDWPKPVILTEDTATPTAAERLAARGGGSILRVGSSAIDCDYNSLAQALGDASSGDTILLERTTELYEGDIYQLHARSMTIRGGYEDCLDDSPSGRTVLDAAGNGGVFDVWLPSTAGPMDVVLENLVIRGGNSGSLGGGGLLIEGRQGGLAVDLINVEVSDNASNSENGGGIRVFVNAPAEAFVAILTVDDSSDILSNTTQFDGGGVACDNPDNHNNQGTVIRLGAINIAGNSAVNGGGVALNNCRRVFIYNGGPVLLIFPAGAIFGNEASANGGGLYVVGESFVAVRGDNLDQWGDPDHAGHILLNSAVQGGGVFVSDGEVELADVVINGNDAVEDGGGIYADGGAIVEQTRIQNEACQPAESSSGLTNVPRCSRMVGNTATNGSGGGYFVTNGSEVDVRRTIISENDSFAAGSVARSTSDTDDNPGVVRVADSLVHGNLGRFLFYGSQTSQIEILWSTVTDNNLGSGTDSVVRAFTTGGSSTELRVISSIIWEESGNVLTLGGNDQQEAFADCVIAHQDLSETDFINSTFYSNVDPILITVDEKPYYPGSISPAIDYCDGFSAEADQIDLVGVVRGTPTDGPTPNPPNLGTYDIGAYETEWQPLSDDLFQDRFEQSQ